MEIEKYDELSKFLQFDEEYESKIFLPNEIFEDLTNSNEFKATNDISFAYSYIYLVTWLYRYCKYSETTETINQRKLKEILGYSPTNKKIDYIIKKNGLLEEIGYLKTTTNYPVYWDFEDGNYDNDDNLIGVTFETYNDLKEQESESFMVKNLNMGKNFNVKYPVKSFHRNGNEEELDGTFYNVEKTFLIPFEVFLYCMANKEIGTIGFYLYSYIKMYNQKFDDSFNASLGRLIRELRIKGRTLNKYMAGLKKYKMVKFWHNQDFFASNLEEENRKPNSYIANDHVLFTGKPIVYDRIKVISEKEYEKMKEEKKINKIEQSKVDIPMEMLPF